MNMSDKIHSIVASEFSESIKEDADLFSNHSLVSTLVEIFLLLHTDNMYLKITIISAVIALSAAQGHYQVFSQ